MGLRFEINATERSQVSAAFSGVAGEAVYRTALLGLPGYETYVRVLELPDPKYPDQPEAEIDETAMNKFLGSDVHLVDTVVEALSNPIDLSQQFTFLLWDGWGWDPELPTESRVHLGSIRSYIPARGSLADWRGWSTHQSETFDPSFVWPDDRAWCVAFDVDAHFAGVGASAMAIQRVIQVLAPSVVRESWESSPPLYG